MREYRDRDGKREPVAEPEHDPVGPSWTAAGLLRLQRLAGNNAVTLAIQRNPTRAENIAALKSEIAEAIADRAKWKHVAFRLNAFIHDDLPNVCVEIPAAHLRAARSAVKHHLAGWPTQTSILDAIDSLAKKRKVAARPLSSDIWAAYSTVSYRFPPAVAWERIGGSIGRKYDGQNSCAARVSFSLNHGTAPLLSGEDNDAATTFKGTPGDGRKYIVWVPTLQGYLSQIWGKADVLLTTSTEVDDLEDSLLDGEVAVFTGEGHAGLIKRGYVEPSVRSHLPAHVWILPL